MKKTICLALFYSFLFLTSVFAKETDNQIPVVDRIGIGVDFQKGIWDGAEYTGNKMTALASNFLVELETGYNPHITKVQQFELGYYYQKQRTYPDVHAIDFSYALMGRFYMGDYAFFQLGFSIDNYIALGRVFHPFYQIFNDSGIRWFIPFISPVLGFGFRVPLEKSDITFSLGLKLEAPMVFVDGKLLSLGGSLIYHFG